MTTPNCAEDGSQILRNFRSVVKSYVELFRAQRDHVHHLLGGRHPYSSGAFRESLLRTFLTNVLPRSVSVDSGFIYGFEQVPNSKQIDILVWDSSHHAAVFQTGEFVIVAPESVIAAIAVKTTLERRDVYDSLDNLLSIVPIDIAYRRSVYKETNESMHRPILKAVVAYRGSESPENTLRAFTDFYERLFEQDGELANSVCDVLRNFDPVHPREEHVAEIDRIFPALAVAIESNEMSLLRGWGPPEDRLGTNTYGPGLRRLPYMYAQNSNLTTPLEKLVYQVLQATYATLGTRGWSLVSAWGEINPVYGFRSGDADEIHEETGARLLNPDRLSSKVNND